MISFTQGQTIFGDLSGNTSTTNLSRGAYLMNMEHRYLLQKYFNNEASFSISTIGTQSLNITATVALGGTSATLTSAWVYPSSQGKIVFSDGEQRTVTVINNSTALTWQGGITGTGFTLTAALTAGATTATLTTAWAYTSGSYVTQFSDGEQKTVTFTANSTAISWGGGLTGAVGVTIRTSIIGVAVSIGVQQYKLPPDYSKLKTGTLTIGSLMWTPDEVYSREEWDNLNVFPYYADIPDKFFIYNNQFNLWPIPSTTGNIISFNYKRRVPDLSIADYTTPGTISVSNGGTVITGVGTSFVVTTNTTSESRYIQIAQPTGDNLWYQIASVDSTTQITLYSPYQGITVAGASSYTIGQMPLLVEDFQDMLIWKALVFYYSSIVDNKVKKAEYEGLYKEKLELLAEYAGSKTVNVNLSRRPSMRNPNLYGQSFGANS